MQECTMCSKEQKQGFLNDGEFVCKSCYKQKLQKTMEVCYMCEEDIYLRSKMKQDDLDNWLCEEHFVEITFFSEEEKDGWNSYIENMTKDGY